MSFSLDFGIEPYSSPPRRALNGRSAYTPPVAQHVISTDSKQALRLQSIRANSSGSKIVRHGVGGSFHKWDHGGTRPPKSARPSASLICLLSLRKGIHRDQLQNNALQHLPQALLDNLPIATCLQLPSKSNSQNPHQQIPISRSESSSLEQSVMWDEKGTFENHRSSESAEMRGHLFVRMTL